MLATQSSTIHLTRHDLSIKVKDRYANIEYAWTFQNNNVPNTSHALKFDLTLDPNAFISSFYATMDGRHFNGKVKEKPSASQESKVNDDNDNSDLLASPHNISIAQTHSDVPNVYTISAVVAAQSELNVTLGVEQCLLKQLDCNRLDIEILKNYAKYAIVPAMQYVSFEAHIDDQLGVNEVQVPSTQLTSNIFIDSSQVAPSSLSAVLKGRILTQSSLNELSITYKSHNNVPTTDDVASSSSSPQNVVLLDEEHGYFCHVVCDTAIQAQLEADTWQYIPRRVVYMLDRSGSMLHVRWQKCLHALMGSLQQLRGGVDKFCILLFDANIEAYPNNEQMCVCSAESVQHALQWLQTKQVGNGTNINHVLLSGIQLIDKDVMLTQQQQQQQQQAAAADASSSQAPPPSARRFMNQLVFITDGAPTAGEYDTNKIVSNVKHAMQSVSADIQLFCFGVGINSNDTSWTKELNHAFLRALCANTHGFYKRIKQQYADKQLKRYLKCIARPFLYDVHVKYNKHHSSANAPVLRAFTKTKFHAFHLGEDLVICGKLNVAAAATVASESPNDDGAEAKTTSHHLQNVDAELVAKCVSRHGGHTTSPVHITLKSVILALPPNENTIQRIGAYLLLHQCSHKVLSANQQRDALQLALKYGFVTPWTCMAVNDRLDATALCSPPPSAAAVSATALAAMISRAPQTQTQLTQMQAAQAQSAAAAAVNSRNPTQNPPPFLSSMEDDLTPEFRQKVFEIERRIVQHLHQRGYDESHPDYHRYIAKAKELALQKAQKHRMARQQQLMEQMKNGNYASAAPAQHYESANDDATTATAAAAASNGHHASLTQNKTPNTTQTSSSSSKSPKKGLIVLRGLPGSGKTSLARKITKRFPTNSIICTEDRYHWSGKEDGVGVYKFQPEIVFQARELCNKEIRRAVDDSVHLIVVDNHNARISMYEEHIKYAVQKGYRFRIIEFLANYQLIEKYRKRSLKQFPKTIYSKLLKLWEVDPRAEIINPVFAEDSMAGGAGGGGVAAIGGVVPAAADFANTTTAMDGMDGGKHTVNGYHSGGPPITDGYENRYAHDSMLSADNLKMNDDATQFPLKYEVMLQARVRTGYDLKTEHITDLPEGSIVTIEEFLHNRAKISAPCRGWISVKSQYGERIVMPKTKEFSRIGGKVLFKRPIYGQPLMEDGRYPMSGILVDYDEKRRLYQVKYLDGNIQWIDLRDPNIMFMKSATNVAGGGGGVEGNLNAGAQEFRMQTTEGFFNQFFCKDYPQYAAQDTSTVEKMEINKTGLH